MKSKRSKACDISQKTKRIVWERDHERCIFCGSHQAMPNAHVLPRSKGGLGVPENIVTACWQCHEAMDHSSQRERMLKQANHYLDEIYGKERTIRYAKTDF